MFNFKSLNPNKIYDTILNSLYTTLFHLNLKSDTHFSLNKNLNTDLSFQLKIDPFNLNFSCDNNAKTFFWSGDKNNSHIWFDKSLALIPTWNTTPYYDWTKVCINKDFEINPTNPSPTEWDCLFGVEKNDKLGGKIGECSDNRFSSYIFVKLED
jgi:hypothetical protein